MEPAAQDLGDIPSAERIVAIHEEVRAILRGRIVTRAVSEVQKLMVDGAAQQPFADSHRKRRRAQQRQGAVYPSSYAPPPLVADLGQTPAAFVEQAADCKSPLHDEGARLSSQVKLLVRQIADAEAKGVNIATQRREKTKSLSKIASRLKPTEDRIREVMPRHIRDMIQPIKVAFTYVIATAAQAPAAEDLALSLVTGFEAIGDIPPSGWWDFADIDLAEFDIADLDNEAWHDELEREIARDAACVASAPEVRAVYDRTMEEATAGLVHGPFTREQIARQVARNMARGMRRFGILREARLGRATTQKHHSTTGPRQSLRRW